MRFTEDQIALLVHFGMSTDATAAQQLEFYNGLDEGMRNLVDHLGGEAETAGSVATATTTADDEEEEDPETEATASAATGDVQSQIRAALSQDANRRRQIEGILRGFESRGYDFNQAGRNNGDLRAQLLDDLDCDVATASHRIITALDRMEPDMSAGTGVSVGRTQLDKFAAIADQAILFQAGVESSHVYERATNGLGFELREDQTRARSARQEAERNGIMGMSLQGIMRHCLMMGGVRGAASFNGAQLADAIMMPQASVGGFNMSTGDFPLILEAAANKILLVAYASQPTTYRDWAEETSVPNFNEIKRLNLSEAPLLKKVAEGAPAEMGIFKEERETQQAEEWAIGIGLTRKMIVNDDLGAFTRLTSDLGAAVPDTIENEVWDVMLSNSGTGPTMGDGVVMFHTASHGNLAGSGAAPDQTTLIAAISAFAAQAGFGEDGAQRPISVMPSFFLGSLTDYLAAESFITAVHRPNTDRTDPPQTRKISSLTPLEVPQLTVRGERDWYITGPKRRAPISVAYLNNVRAPRLVRVDGTTISGVQFVLRFDCGVNGVEWRTGYRNPGA